ncbi:MAG: 1-deoxy-D-xylulose-5-phosphate reductoisomerase [Gemmatimonadota bacterium]
MERTGVVVLGATGSIGRSTLRVLSRHANRFRVVGLGAGRRGAELDALAGEFKPEFVVLARDPDGREAPAWGGEWRYGPGAVAEAAEDPRAEIVVNGLVGFAGLETTLRALRAGKRLALANKESLVVGGELVLEALRDGGGELVPVDSEHSAIHQCLAGRPADEVRRLILTASGGPFRALPEGDFGSIRAEEALEHPTWSMGDKITIDSATLANKALEVIEAHLLFGVPYDAIEVVVHPESIVHSMVEFRDGSTLAQLGHPTMEVPILYALGLPHRLADAFPPFDPIAASPLTFEALRREAFPMFDLGVAAGRDGGDRTTVYNAANEIAVLAFLDGRLSFPGIAEAVRRTLASCPRADVASLEALEAADARARATAEAEVCAVAGEARPAAPGNLPPSRG